MKTTIEDSNTKLENKLKEFQEVVEEEINQVKEEVKAVEGELSHMKEDKKEINKKIEDLETKVRQLSTKGIIKTERSVAATKIKVPTYDGKVSWNTTIPEGSQDYKAVTSALEKRYGDAHLQHVYQAQLRNRKQRFEQTLQQYEADVSRMVNLAYPTAPAEVEQLSVSSFVDGLRDPEISQLVRLARHKTISESLAQVLEIEAVKQASRRTSKIRQVKAYHGKDRMETANSNLADIIIEVVEKYKKGQDSENSTMNGSSTEDPSVVGPAVSSDT
ncbi:hypothetical protein NQ315_012440 [Exocentrus adspersus]|uniref:Uncharacterized protein n=1 Tax=Exocentrus adspersus TaxID=1586481 RepID=A0AAV8VMG0_9CUCU|nr:hypothetical protein NQ315_012440 [Exocentrus adspersus]